MTMLRIVKHDRNTEKYNRWKFWEIPGTILGKILSIFNSGLISIQLWYNLISNKSYQVSLDWILAA